MALNKLTTKMTEQEARATQNQNNLHLLASEGTIDEQTIFDELAKKTSESSGAELIGVSPIDGIEGDTAQAVLGSINTQLSQKAPLTALSAAISAHNSDTAAHGDIREKIGADISTHNSSGEAHKNIQKNMSDLATKKANAALADAKEYADIKAQSAQISLESHNASGEAHSDIRDKIGADISTHNADSAAHGALFGSINTQLQGISGGLADTVEKGNATADTVALLQKYPSYEYATSGGTVQRFDDVSVIPHTIGVTVHGATDENGNSVTNPTVSVYGKNLFKFIDKSINGYVFSGSNCTIVNPTQYYGYPDRLSLMLPAGTYTFSCRVTGSREYANKSNFNVHFYIGKTQTNIDMSNFVSGTETFKKTFTITEPTAFYSYDVRFTETPTSADLSLDFQLEVGSTATEYEPYIEPQTVAIPITMGEGEAVTLNTLNAISPTMMVIATDDNSLISKVDIKYNRTNKAKEEFGTCTLHVTQEGENAIDVYYDAKYYRVGNMVNVECDLNGGLNVNIIEYNEIFVYGLPFTMNEYGPYLCGSYRNGPYHIIPYYLYGSTGQDGGAIVFDNSNISAYNAVNSVISIDMLNLTYYTND